MDNRRCDHGDLVCDEDEDYLDCDGNCLNDATDDRRFL